MSRYFRNAAILAKVESTYGTDSGPTGAANAMLVSNMSISHAYDNVDRELIRPYFGGSEQLAGHRRVEIGFDVELAGSGAAGTAPAWGVLLKGCAMAETVTAGARVEYLPVTASQDSLTLYYHVDGVLHKALGCRGTVDMKMEAGGRPLLSVKFTGLDGGSTAAANPTPTLTAWKAPVVITDPNAGDILLGCAYNTGALSGGTAFPSRGLSLTLGNDVKHTALLGGESVNVTGRQATGKVALELTAAQEATARADVAANTLTSLGFQFGTTAGYKVLVHAPAVQRINPAYEDVDGVALVAFDLRLLPSAASGNDELRIVAL